MHNVLHCNLHPCHNSRRSSEDGRYRVFGAGSRRLRLIHTMFQLWSAGQTRISARYGA